jgi:hypothetical protein
MRDKEDTSLGVKAFTGRFAPEYLPGYVVEFLAVGWRMKDVNRIGVGILENNGYG